MKKVKIYCIDFVGNRGISYSVKDPILNSYRLFQNETNQA